MPMANSDEGLRLWLRALSDTYSAQEYPSVKRVEVGCAKLPMRTL
jgi:hypothetical protein